MLSTLLFALLILTLILATLQDLRERLVNDAFLLTISLLSSILFTLRLAEDPRGTLLTTLPGVLLVLLTSFLFWRLGIWADGDAILAPFLALALPNMTSMLLFLTLSLLTGGMLALAWLIILLIRTKQRVQREALLPSLLLGLALALPFHAHPLLMLSIFLIITSLTLLILTGKRVEETLFTKRVPLSSIIPGDWVIRIETPRGEKPWEKRTGITAEEIRMFKAQGVTHAWIKLGMPFIPALTLGFLLTLLLYTFKPSVLLLTAWL